MWTIIGLISKNPEISLSSRNNPEMSQHSSDLPMLANFSIYVFPNIFSDLAGIIQIIKSPLTTMLIKYQKLLTNCNCLNFLMFLHGDVCHSVQRGGGLPPKGGLPRGGSSSAGGLLTGGLSLGGGRGRYWGRGCLQEGLPMGGGGGKTPPNQKSEKWAVRTLLELFLV